MRLEHYDDETGFAQLKPDWNRLLASSNANTVFSTWEWQSTWWRHQTEGELRLTAVRGEGDALIALFPCFQVQTSAGRQVIRLLGCIEVADYLDLILAQGLETPALQAFIDQLTAGDRPRWDAVELCNVREESPTCAMLPALAEAAGLRVEVSQEDVCPRIELPAEWEAYLLSIDKKQRHEIRRKLRRAEGAGAMDWYVVGAEHDLHQEVDTFLALHEQSSSEKQRFMNAGRRDFFHDLAQEMFDAGWLQLMHLKLDDVVEASLLSFDYANEIMLYNSGYNPQRSAALSPGIVLIALSIRHAIELQRDVFDFLRGDETYKYRFGAKDKPVYRVLIEPGA